MKGHNPVIYPDVMGTQTKKRLPKDALSKEQSS